MIRLIRAAVSGLAMGFIVFSMTMAISYVKCLLSGLPYPFQDAVVISSKMAGIAGGAIILLSLIGRPRSMTPGGR